MNSFRNLIRNQGIRQNRIMPVGEVGSWSRLQDSEEGERRGEESGELLAGDEVVRRARRAGDRVVLGGRGDEGSLSEECEEPILFFNM